MRQSHELPIEDGILTQAADGDAHAAFVIHILLDLRAIVFGQVLDELLRGVRQTQLGGLAGITHQTVDELLLGRILAEIDEHGGGVAVEHGHTDALRSDAQRAVERYDLTLLVIHMTEDLERFLLGFRFLAGDERNDVAQHFRPIVECLACAGDGLIGAHDDFARFEFLPRGESRRIGLD